MWEIVDGAANMEFWLQFSLRVLCVFGMAVVAWSQVELLEKQLSRCDGMAHLGKWLNSDFAWEFRELLLLPRIF